MLRAEWFRDQEGTPRGWLLGHDSGRSTRGLASDRFGYAGSFYESRLVRTGSEREHHRFAPTSGSTGSAATSAVAPGLLSLRQWQSRNSQTLIRRRHRDRY